MADVVSELAGQSGISPEKARQGMGAVLALFKDNLPPESYAEVSAAVPDADRLAAAAPAAPEESGGLFAAVTGAVKKLFGAGGPAAQLASRLAAIGFSAEQLQAFLPKVLEFFKSKLPGKVTQQISGLLPTPEEGGRPDA